MLQEFRLQLLIESNINVTIEKLLARVRKMKDILKGFKKMPEKQTGIEL
jgi:hypothetical protein